MRKFLFLIASIITFQVSIAQTSTFSGTGGAISSKAGVVVDSFPITVSNVGAINGTTFGLTSVSLNLTMNRDSIQEIYIKNSASATDTVFLYLRPIDRTVNGVLKNNNFNATFINTSLNPIWTSLPPFNGKLLPDGMLGLLNDGRVADGTWKLYVKTNNPSSGGVSGGLVNSCSLTFSNKPAENISINKTASLPSKLCNDAPLICDFNGFLGKTNSGMDISPILKDKIENDTKCGGIIHNNSFIKFIAGSTTVSFDLYVYNSRYNKEGMQMWIVDGSAVCGTSGSVKMYPDISGGTCSIGLDGVNVGYVTPTTYKAKNLTIGNTYYIVFDGATDDYCDFIIKPSAGSNSVQSSISLTPQNAVVCLGQSVTLNATSNGSSAPTWATIPSSALSSLSGNTVTFNSSTSTPASTTPYTVTVSGGTTGTCPASAQSKITVVETPSFTAQPSTTSYTILSSSGKTFSPLSVTVSPSTGIYYQWYSNANASNSGGVAISGATSSTYTPPNTTGTYYYYCVITNNACTEVSNLSGAYTVNLPPTSTCTANPDAIEFIQQPSDVAQSVAMTPAVTVRAFCKSTGDTYTGSTPITITAINGCGFVTLTQNTSSGIATFSNVLFTRSVQTGVSLLATAPSANNSSVTSNTFNVTAPSGSGGGTKTINKTIASNDFEVTSTNTWSFTSGTPTYSDEDYFGTICNSGNCYLSKTTKQPVTYDVTKWSGKSITLATTPTDLFIDMSILNVDGSAYSGNKTLITKVAGKVITVDTKLTGSKPANVTFAWTNTSGYLEDKNTVTFSPLTNLTKYTNLKLNFKVASLSDLGSAVYNVLDDGGAAGNDQKEDLIIETSTDGGNNWNPLLTYNGANNLLIPFSNNVNTLTYKVNNTFSYSLGGVQSNAPSAFSVSIPNGVSKFQFRVTATNNRFSEHWVVDDVSLTGDTTVNSSPATPSPLPTVSVAGSATICPGSTASLSSAVSNVVGTPIYSWSPDTALQSSTIQNPQTINLKHAQSYSLTITDADGCTATAGPLNISMFSQPILNSQPTPQQVDVCLNGTVDPLTIDAINTESYHWYVNTTNSTVGTDVANGSSSTFTPPTDVAGTFYYYCVIGSNCNSLKVTTNVFGPYVVKALPVVSAPSAVCVGSNVTLSPINGGTWTSSDNTLATVTNAGVVTGVAAGSPTFTFKDGTTSCSATTTAITVNASPTVSITGNSEICVGNTTTLSPTTGGTWASSNTAYATVTSTGVVTSVAAGKPTFTFTPTVGGCSATTTQVTINALPVVSIVASDNPVCPSGNSTLTASGADTYSWNGGSTNNLITVNPSTSTTYTVTGTNSTTKCSNTSSITINTGTNATASVAIAANPSGAVCEGTSVTFTATPTSGGSAPTYQWYKGGTLINGETGVTYSYKPTDQDVITCVMVSNSACVTTKTVTSNAITESITAIPNLIISNPATVCSPSTVDITSASTIATGTTGGLTYSYWKDNAATITYSTPTASPAGTYYIKGTINGCSIVAPVKVTVEALPTLKITNPTAVCSPSTVDITTSSITSGSTTGLTYSYWTNLAATVSYTTPTSATSGTYYIKGTTIAGCTDIKSATVTVNASPSLSITNPTIACNATTADLTDASVTVGSTAGLAYTYWTDANATLPYATPTAATSGSYYIKGTNSATGCFDIQPVTVSASSLTLKITNPAPVCSPSTVNLQDVNIIAGSSSGISCSFYIDATATIPCSTPKAITASGTYYIKATTTGGCSDIKPVIVAINPLPTAAIVGTASVCIGGISPVITFTGGAGTSPYTFTYNVNGGSSSTITSVGNTATINAPTTASGSFAYNVVSVEDASTTTCSQAQTGTATVTVNPLPTATITGNATVCFGGTAPVITFTGATGTSPYTFTYNINGGPSLTVTSVGNKATINAPTTASGSFIYNLVSVVDASANACSQLQTGTATVTVNSASSATIAGSTTVCNGATSPVVTLTGSGGTSPYTFTYNINGGSNHTVTSTGDVATINAPTSVSGSFAYNLVSVVDASINACPQLQTGAATVKISAAPAAPSVQATNPTCSVATGSVKITSATTALTFSTDGTTYATYTTPYTFAAGASFSITAKNADGCYSTPVTGKIDVQPATPVAFDVSGSGSFCPNGVGVAVALSGSEPGVNYQLQIAGVNTGTPLAGTGAGLTFPKQTIAGTYTVFATNATSGCTANMKGSAIITKSIAKTLTVTIAATKTSICLGGDVTLAASAANAGTDATYKWKINGVVVETTDLGTFYTTTDVLKNNDTISCVLFSNIGCLVADSAISNKIGFKVIEPPIVQTITSSAKDSVCQNATITLSNATTGGTWSSDNKNIATVNTGGLVTGVKAGIDSIRYTVRNACFATTKSLGVKVVALTKVAAILGDSVICKGATVQLTTKSTGGTWSVADKTIDTVDTHGEVAGLQFGKDVVSYTLAGYCNTDVANYSVKVIGKKLDSKDINMIAPTCLSPFGGKINMDISGSESPYTFKFKSSTYPSTSIVTNVGEGIYNIYFYNYNSCLVDSFPHVVVISSGNCDTLYVPTGFLPGRQTLSGKDNLLKPFGGSLETISSLLFRVYNRLGNLVFVSHDLYSGWDGTYKGVAQGTGTYVWYLDYSLTNGKPPIHLQGTSVLIR